MKTVNLAKPFLRKILHTRKKFYAHKTASVDSSKNYFLKNAKKTCKRNNRDLNRD